MSDTETMLERMVKTIAEELSDPTIAPWYKEYLETHNEPEDVAAYEAGEIDLYNLEVPTAVDYINICVYDIRYIVGSALNYLGAELMVAGGGPTIWVSTLTNSVEGYWGGKELTCGFIDELDLDEYLADYYDIIRGT